ncbi:MAG: universal stress protein [Thermoprotei archaeon]
MPKLYSNVLVAVDGSEFSIKAVEASTRVVDPKTGVVTIVMVVEPQVMNTYQPFYDAFKTSEQGSTTSILPESLHKSRLKEAEEVVQKAREIVMSAGIAVNTKVLEGEPAKTIVDEAKQGYELVVIATWGLKGIRRHILGSIATKVVQESPCSVLVVR